jgi:hypothetical protein
MQRPNETARLRHLNRLENGSRVNNTVKGVSEMTMTLKQLQQANELVQEIEFHHERLEAFRRSEELEVEVTATRGSPTPLRSLMRRDSEWIQDLIAKMEKNLQALRGKLNDLGVEWTAEDAERAVAPKGFDDGLGTDIGEGIDALAREARQEMAGRWLDGEFRDPTREEVAEARAIAKHFTGDEGALPERITVAGLEMLKEASSKMLASQMPAKSSLKEFVEFVDGVVAGLIRYYAIPAEIPL